MGASLAQRISFEPAVLIARASYRTMTGGQYVEMDSQYDYWTRQTSFAVVGAAAGKTSVKFRRTSPTTLSQTPQPCPTPTQPRAFPAGLLLAREDVTLKELPC